MAMNNLRIMVGVVLLVLSMAACLACDQCNQNLKPHRVIHYSGGQKIGEWASTAKPYIDSARIQFIDARNGRLVEVTGTVQVECP